MKRKKIYLGEIWNQRGVVDRERVWMRRAAERVLAHGGATGNRRARTLGSLDTGAFALAKRFLWKYWRRRRATSSASARLRVNKVLGVDVAVGVLAAVVRIVGLVDRFAFERG